MMSKGAIQAWNTILQKQKICFIAQLKQDRQKYWHFSAVYLKIQLKIKCTQQRLSIIVFRLIEMGVAQRNCKYAAFGHFLLGNRCIYLFADLSHCSRCEISLILTAHSDSHGGQRGIYSRGNMLQIKRYLPKSQTCPEKNQVRKH